MAGETLELIQSGDRGEERERENGELKEREVRRVSSQKEGGDSLRERDMMDPNGLIGSPLKKPYLKI